MHDFSLPPSPRGDAGVTEHGNRCTARGGEAGGKGNRGSQRSRSPTVMSDILALAGASVAGVSGARGVSAAGVAGALTSVPFATIPASAHATKSIDLVNSLFPAPLDLARRFGFTVFSTGRRSRASVEPGPGMTLPLPRAPRQPYGSRRLFLRPPCAPFRARTSRARSWWRCRPARRRRTLIGT